MINNRLIWYVEYNGIITVYQSDFRKKRSTIDQIIRLESAVREAFKNKDHLVTVYFDLEKAYDTTWKCGIMKDLHDAGLRGHCLSLYPNFYQFENFLSELEELCLTYMIRRRVLHRVASSMLCYHAKYMSII